MSATLFAEIEAIKRGLAAGGSGSPRVANLWRAGLHNHARTPAPPLPCPSSLAIRPFSLNILATNYPVPSLSAVATASPVAAAQHPALQPPAQSVAPLATLGSLEPAGSFCRQSLMAGSPSAASSWTRTRLALSTATPLAGLRTSSAVLCACSASITWLGTAASPFPFSRALPRARTASRSPSRRLQRPARTTTSRAASTSSRLDLSWPFARRQRSRLGLRALKTLADWPTTNGTCQLRPSKAALVSPSLRHRQRTTYQAIYVQLNSNSQLPPTSQPGRIEICCCPRPLPASTI